MCIKRLNGNHFTLKKEDGNIYIGRTVKGNGEWGNPFKLKDYDYNRLKVLALYEEYLLSDKERLVRGQQSQRQSPWLLVFARNLSR